MESNVRRMQIEDLPQVLSIEELSFPTPWSANAFRFELLENPNGHCWVAEQGKVIAGFIVCWLIVDEMHIASIAVHPKFRGEGTSKKLIITGLRELISKGARSATLEVRAGNLKVQYLYRYFDMPRSSARNRKIPHPRGFGQSQTSQSLARKFG